MRQYKISTNLVTSYVTCPRNAYFKLFDDSEAEATAYAKYVQKVIKNNISNYIKDANNCKPFIYDNFGGRADVIINATFASNDLGVDNICLLKNKTKSNLGEFSYEPLIFSSSHNVTETERIEAAYVGHVLSKIQELYPLKATIILIDGKNRSIRLSAQIDLTIKKLRQWIDSKPNIPQRSTGQQCCMCFFEKKCVSISKHENCLSLLGNMTTKKQKKYASKGIFTIDQMSYLYKPRRRSRHWGEKKPTHQFELQALALRTKTIYTTDLTVIPKEDIEIYIDIESVPNQRFHYLFGVLINKLGNQNFAYCWADNISDEENEWQRFLKLIALYPNAPVFHYGSYEKKVITDLAKKYKTNVDDFLDRLCNINTYIYGRIYFPTFTNSLKDICNYLGYFWSTNEASGLNSIVWRYNYDKGKDQKLKGNLIIYNKEDCKNLKKLKDFLSDICSSNTAIPNVKAANEKNQLLNTSSSRVVKSFAAIVKSAHGKYEEAKISFKKINVKKQKSARSKTIYIPKYKIDKVIRIRRGKVCPKHKHPLARTDLIAEFIITDLIRTSKGIKKTIIKYWGYKGRCYKCAHTHNPPGIKKFGKRGTKYGYGLKAWIAYQRLAMRLPFRKITQLLEDSFDIQLASGGISALLKSFYQNYKITEKKILTNMLKSNKIHADETLVNIQGKMQYVWVFTDGKNVIFRLTPTRESIIVHDLLKNYEGVLVSDFFGGYDAVDCLQQKCWVPLIRDINDDLRENPFDQELESFTINLQSVIIPIFDAIKKYGLKKRNLNKFKKLVESFYINIIDGIDHKSDIVKKYKKRFYRYRQSLFVFLDHDGIPWNNNLAERALRHLAVQRKISGSFTALGITNYLILLGVTQTCRFKNISLLEFLMSGEFDIDKYKGKKNSIGWQMR